MNQLLGDIVKVTPTSKAVGDMALFLVANDLTCDDVVNSDRDLAFPESVLDLVSGRMGQTPGGFPEAVQKRILRGEEPLTERPGSILPPADFEDAATTVQKMINRTPTDQEIVSYLLYPKVFEDFAAHQRAYYDTSGLPTYAFFNGLEPEEEIAVDIAPGKTLIIKFLAVGKPQTDGCRTVFFELNGQPREVVIVDKALKPQDDSRRKADPGDQKQIGSVMPGVVVSLTIKVGSKVKAGDQLMMLEAMKMQTSVISEQDGVVKEILVEAGTQVESGDLLIVLE